MPGDGSTESTTGKYQTASSFIPVHQYLETVFQVVIDYSIQLMAVQKYDEKAIKLQHQKYVLFCKRVNCTEHNKVEKSQVNATSVTMHHLIQVL